GEMACLASGRRTLLADGCPLDFDATRSPHPGLDGADRPSYTRAMSAVLLACRDLPTRRFEAGDVLLEEGSPAGVLFVLAGGAVGMVKGDVQITTVTEPGSFFGEMSVLLGMPHTATVRALEPSVFHVVDDALGFLHAHPECAFEVARLLARRLHFVNSYLVDLK